MMLNLLDIYCNITNVAIPLQPTFNNLEVKL